MSESDDQSVLPAALSDALLEASAPIQPSEEAKTRMLSSLLDRVKAQKDTGSDDLLITKRAEEEEWLETAPGNRVKILRDQSEGTSILVQLEPGATFPAHSHPEDEETFVVAGETWFGDLHLKAGDYHLARKGTEHGEVRTETGCTLFIRKATD